MKQKQKQRAKADTVQVAITFGFNTLHFSEHEPITTTLVLYSLTELLKLLVHFEQYWPGKSGKSGSQYRIDP